MNRLFVYYFLCFLEALLALVSKPPDPSADELTDEQLALLESVDLYSPGAYRGPEEPADLNTYPANPTSPTLRVPDRTALLRDIDAGLVVVLRTDLQAIVGSPAKLEKCSDALLTGLFFYIDVTYDFGGSDPLPGETVDQHGFRQRERVMQTFAKDMRTARALTIELQGYLKRAVPSSPDQIRATRHARYYMMHKLLLNIEFSPSGAIARISRPDPTCTKCFNNDPRVQLYCDSCYRILNILL